MIPALSLDALCINTLSFLCVDAVQKANSGHPGLPLGAAAMAYVLWTRFVKHHPANPDWFDRAQFAAADGLRRGAYILADAPNGKPDLILIASGSEVALIVAARFLWCGQPRPLIWHSRCAGQAEAGNATPNLVELALTVCICFITGTERVMYVR